MTLAPPISVSTEKLKAFLKSASSSHVTVVGDLMLDEYIGGTVSRVSPEAPVPVVRATKTFHRLGGAANVAHGIVALGGQAALHGMIGLDEAGGTFLAACREVGIDASAVVRDDGGPTTRKVRVLAHQQQMLRVDWETVRAPNTEQIRVSAQALESGKKTQGVVLSDYAKGFLSEELLGAFLGTARRHNIPVLVDPKSPDLKRYDGATVITPNLKELGAVLGRQLHDLPEAEIAHAAQAVLRDRQAVALLVTMGERGLMVVPREGEAAVIRATAREVFDVTGAGDTVIAVVALGLASGLSLTDAAAIANLAAGVVVGRVGTSVASPLDLLALLPEPPSSRVLGRDALSRLAADWRAQGKKIVFTNGCFDLVHIGHVETLRQAASFGDKLIVGLNSDDSVKRLKGPTRPLINEHDRARLLSEFSCVDAVTIFDEETPLALIEAIKPHVLVKGGDYRHDQVVGGAFVESIGGEVKLIPLVPERSTTRIVGLIKDERHAGG